MRMLRTFVVTFIITLFLGLVFVTGYVLGDQRGGPKAAASSAFGLLWDVQDLLNEEFLGQLPSEEVQAYGAVHGLVQTYNDPYTVFVEPAPRELERDDLRGHFGGIGANLSRNEQGQLVIMPIPERPAALAGVQNGDILLAVDDTPVTSEMTLNQVVALVRGEAGTSVRLTLQRSGVTEALDITVVRERIETPSVEWRVLDPDEFIGYLRISIMGEQTNQELTTGLKELEKQGINKLVLDLRGNGGGYLDAAIDTSSQFVREGVVMHEIKRGTEERFYSVKPTRSPAHDWSIVVLIDGATASAAEIVAGALRDHNRGILIGEKSYGKGSVQRVHELRDGSSLHVTIARWLTPDRHEIDRTGLEPDITVSISPQDREAGVDSQLARAEQWLREGV